MKLLFDITKLPRSTTREEWKLHERWARVTRKGLKHGEEQRLALLRKRENLPERIRLSMIEDMVNPPLLLGPYQ